MERPLAVIRQSDKDIGFGRLGGIVPSGEQGAEVTLYDVRMAGLEFEPAGPFRLVIEDKKFDRCRPVNFRNLRPGMDYERVILVTEEKPRV